MIKSITMNDTEMKNKLDFLALDPNVCSTTCEAHPETQLPEFLCRNVS